MAQFLTLHPAISLHMMRRKKSRVLFFQITQGRSCFAFCFRPHWPFLHDELLHCCTSDHPHNLQAQCQVLPAYAERLATWANMSREETVGHTDTHACSLRFGKPRYPLSKLLLSLSFEVRNRSEHEKHGPDRCSKFCRRNFGHSRMTLQTCHRQSLAMLGHACIVLWCHLGLPMSSVRQSLHGSIDASATASSRRTRKRYQSGHSWYSFARLLHGFEMIRALGWLTQRSIILLEPLSISPTIFPVHVC